MSSAFRVPGDDRNDDYWYNFGYEALELSINAYALDGHEGTHGLDDSELVVDDVDWDTLTISGMLSIPDGLTDYVFEEGVRPPEAGRLLVRGDCIQTHNRFIAFETSDFPASGEVSFEAAIDSNSAHGTSASSNQPSDPQREDNHSMSLT